MSVGAWHFVRLVDGVPTLRDGRPMPTDGSWLVHDGPVVPCKSGLHASERPLDAFQHLEWSDAAVCLVECDGEIKRHGADKLACSRRRVVAWAPCDDALRGFARRCALAVIDLWDAPQIVRTFLLTGDESIKDAARDATWSPARSAAESAARGAVWDAAWNAARGAAWVAVRSAAEVAESAARGAVWDAAWNAQNADLESAFLKLLGIEVAS